jgi:cytochrome c oxidase cbb3-type subunit 2
MWGPVKTLEQLRSEHPPLIGNRRQGPDLAEVGNRRSPLWLKAHFFDPPEVSGASIMPQYGFLFGDQRGNDLVAYLTSLQGGDTQQHLNQERGWRPSATAVSTANAKDGQRLFQRYCATCHGPGGSTRWQWHFKRIPPDLSVGPYLDFSSTAPHAERADRLAQIIKFGVHGTDMPGHEYLPDNDIASLTLWLSQTIAQPVQKP